MARLNRKRAREIFTMSKQQKWGYPKIFDALKAAGVEYYETDVARHGIVYHESGEAIPEPPPPESLVLLARSTQKRFLHSEPRSDQDCEFSSRNR
jgi:hypothetical protein